LLLFALGLLLARPFLTDRLCGTGEAYNYSLAIADALEQLRAGEVPPLVGQTEYAFNGRVHPLRNAPYLFYFAAAVDRLTFGQLPVWQLQNLCLAFSLVALLFSTYGGLRWGTGCGRGLALLLSAALAFSPSILAITYPLNLFMSVHAMVFAPWALAACARQARQPGLMPDLVLAGALAATWLAHPPIALWITLSAAVARLAVLASRPRWSNLIALALAAGLFVSLSVFGFVSALSLHAGLADLHHDTVSRDLYIDPILDRLHDSLPAALLPVSRSADGFGDLQLGYVGFALLGLAVTATMRHARRLEPSARAVLAAAVALLATATFLLALTLPLPGVTRWLWAHLPGQVHALTNIWPMQRLYPVLMLLAVFSTALIALARPVAERRALWRTRALALLAVIWTAWQAYPFLRHGLQQRWSTERTLRAYTPSNVDLTITSYSYVGTPPTFVHGVADPLFEFRFERADGSELPSPYEIAETTGQPVARGRLMSRPNANGHAIVPEGDELLLTPGKRYLLRFEFDAPFSARLELQGSSLARRYFLPSAGNARGFGLQEGNRRSIPLWTSQESVEAITVGLEEFRWSDGAEASDGAIILSYTLLEVPLDTLPVRLHSLIPLHFSVDMPEAGGYVLTPRRYVSGYQATVNGRPIAPQRSDDYSVAIPVPRGTAEVELRYVGVHGVQAAFWWSTTAWAVYIAAGLTLAAWPRAQTGLEVVWRRPAVPIATAAILIGALAWIGSMKPGPRIREPSTPHRLPGTAGPALLQFYLPLERLPGVSQALLTTGETGAGAVIFVHYIDSEHIRLGADVWGSLLESEPIRADYFQRQQLVVNMSSLYPDDAPELQRLGSGERMQAKQLRLEWNGEVVLEARKDTYPSRPDQVFVASNPIGGSIAPASFTGRLLNIRRLPIPRSLAIVPDLPLAVEFVDPGDSLVRPEPLLGFGGEQASVLAITRDANGGLRFGYLPAGREPVWSAAIPSAPNRRHELTVSLQRGDDGSGATVLRCEREGTMLLDVPAPELPIPLLVRTGVVALPGVPIAARFTGEMLEVSHGPRTANASTVSTAAVAHVLLQFPAERTGHSEPLVVSGHTGAADVVYVIYVDNNHVRVGVDHWGVGAVTSDPIRIDYTAPHYVQVEFGLEDSSGSNAGAGWQHLRVLLDERQVLESRARLRPVQAAEFFVGRNDIGASTCEPSFTGQVLWSQLSPQGGK
jgi:hypothetical protein